MDFMVDLPDMLSRDVGLRLCLAMVELIWMDVSSLQQQGNKVQQMVDMSENRADNFHSAKQTKIQMRYVRNENVFNCYGKS